MAPKRWLSVLLGVFVLVSFWCIAAQLSSGASRALTMLGERGAANPESISYLYAIVSLSALQEVMLLKAAILAIALGCAVVGLAGLVLDFESAALHPTPRRGAPASDATLEGKPIPPAPGAVAPPPAPAAPVAPPPPPVAPAPAASAQSPSVPAAPAPTAPETAPQATPSAPTAPAPAAPAQVPHAPAESAALVSTPPAPAAPVQIPPASAETAAPVTTPPTPPASAQTPPALGAPAATAPAAASPAQRHEEAPSTSAPRKGTVLVFLVGLGAGLLLLSAQIKPELKPLPSTNTAAPGFTGSHASKSQQVSTDGGLPDAGGPADGGILANDGGSP
jgi:hypothetical protein